MAFIGEDWGSCQVPDTEGAAGRVWGKEHRLEQECKGLSGLLPWRRLHSWGSQPAFTPHFRGSGEMHMRSVSPGQQFLHLNSKQVVPVLSLLLLLLTDTQDRNEQMDHPGISLKPPGHGKLLSAISLFPLS